MSLVAWVMMIIYLVGFGGASLLLIIYSLKKG